MGKSSAPPPPDYAAAAKATSEGDLEAARYATNANRVNQYTPYGSLTYSQANTPDSFDQAGYDAALAKYQTGSPSSEGGGGKIVTDPDSPYFGSAFPGTGGGTTGGTSTTGQAPNRADYIIKGSQDGPWTQTQTLTPQAQATLDKQIALSDKYADTASAGFDKISGLLANPQLDTSALPTVPNNVLSGQRAQDLALSRLQPQFAQQEEALRARLANQGITLGSGAYGQEMLQQSQARNDAQTAAAMQGISLDQQNRASTMQERQNALQEQSYLQDRPLNLVNALRTGAQVQSPQFSNVPQQQTTKGADIMGATTQGYNAALGSTNASNAASASTSSGLLSAAAIAASMFF